MGGRRGFGEAGRSARASICVGALGAALLVASCVTAGSSPPSSGAVRQPPASGMSRFDNGQYTFAYPSEWGSLSQGGSISVFGTGSWCSGMPSSGCSEETIDVSGGRVVLSVWETSGPPGYCVSGPPFAQIKVEKHVEDAMHASLPTTRWEIARPGFRFGMTGNVWIEVVTANSDQMSRAAAVVATFRWDPAGDWCSSPTAAPQLPGSAGHFANGTFSFDYPSTWRYLSGDYYEGMANEVYLVLGDGGWHSGCTQFDNGGACTGDMVDVSGGRIVTKLYSRVGGPVALCADIPANATFGPNAVMESRVGGAVLWEFRRPGSQFGLEGNLFVQVWANGSTARAAAEALLASFRWDAGIGTGGMCYPMDSPSPSES
jgi:hypothetical protein